MNKKLIYFVAFSFLAILAYGQSVAGGTRRSKSTITNYTLSVNVNINSYSIMIDNQMVKGRQFSLPQGNHNIAIRSRGYQDWHATINLNRDQRLNVNMIPNQFRLTVQTNTNSSIYIDKKMVSKNSYNQQLNPGTYTILIKAKGFIDYNTVVNLDRDTNINAILLPVQHTLTVQTNTNSSIYINKEMVANNSFNQQLNPGTYTILVKANGFIDYVATVNLDRNTNIVANLQPMLATVNVFVSPDIQNRNIKGALNQVRIYDNGIKVNDFNFSVPPGKHTIRFESGALAVEGFYEFEAGKTYNIEPILYLNLKQ